MDSVHIMTDTAAIDALLAEPSALLLKHGRSCPISAAARDEIDAFVGRHPDAPVYALEVTEHRALSDDVAQRLGIAHASPQAILLRAGEPVWRAERFDVTADAIERALRA
jgi:bacillithiol system protein YtxJ